MGHCTHEYRGFQYGEILRQTGTATEAICEYANPAIERLSSSDADLMVACSKRSLHTHRRASGCATQSGSSKPIFRPPFFDSMTADRFPRLRLRVKLREPV
jgi:hypothetical protein